jgi:hypothetical protein
VNIGKYVKMFFGKKRNSLRIAGVTITGSHKRMRAQWYVCKMVSHPNVLREWSM